jgi:hypothetical protein
MEKSCEKSLACGHYCTGFKGEKKCLPCLNEDCVNNNPQITLS